MDDIKEGFTIQFHPSLSEGDIVCLVLQAAVAVQLHHRAIADGDTVSTVANKELTRVRIVGIDCPESNQPFGDEAKQFTANLCMKKDVELVGDEEDRYGRRLADVVVRGQSLRETLLSAGLAWHYKKYSDDPDLARLEDEARAAKRGLWANEDSVPPWEWRGQN